MVLSMGIFNSSLNVLQNSGHEFHADLYPDTVGTTAAMSADEWWQGGNKQVTLGIFARPVSVMFLDVSNCSSCVS